MAGVNVATLVAKLEAQTRDFDRHIAESERRLQGLEGSSSRAATGVGRLSTAMRSAAALGVAAFAVDLFKTGIQVEAWGRRFETVFGESQDIVADWADDMNERLGVSEERLRGTASAVGDLFVPMGFARDAAAELTTETLTLAAALSEWTGGTRSAEEAAHIITRAILGEREALISLGVKISEADVEARLLEKGMEGLTGEALQQARAMATLELITERSADAMTAFGEGGSDALRAQNELKAALDELKVTMSQLVVEAAPLVIALAEIVGIITVPFRGGFVDTLNAATEGIRAMTAADLEAVRANELLYEAIMKVKMALGGKDFGTKGANSAAKGGRGGFGFGEFHSGGMVPGPTGATVPILAMAGERVVPAGQSGGGGGGTIVVNVGGSVVSERDLVEAVRRGLRRERISGGSLEL